jgi:hypothetical protein
MKRILGAVLLMVLGAGMLWASDNAQALGVLRNARYVYVTSYDGDQFSMDLFPQDREAIANVQDALRKSGKYMVVYEPHNADMVLAVMSRPSEDVLAVYDARHAGLGGTYLWRTMGRGGLDKNETPLVKQFLDNMAKFNK